MNVYLASDHTGIALKAALGVYIRSLGYRVTDLGPVEVHEGDDYPQTITPCAERVASEKSEDEASGARGIVIGGSGQGEAMASNRVHGARAIVFYGPRSSKEPIDAEGTAPADGYDIVRLGRMHNDANILSLAARFVSEDEAVEAVRLFLETPFSREQRHVRRVAELG